MSNIKVFVNPTAGNGAGKSLLTYHGVWQTIITVPNQIEQQIREHIQPNDSVIIAGGDGTVHLVINALFQAGLSSTITLALLPLGTGNDLARTYGFTQKKLPELIDQLQKATTIHTLPLWKINNTVFCNYISWGIDAEILAHVERWRRKLPCNRWGNFILYFMAGLRALLTSRRNAFVINQQTELLYGIALTNIRYYAGGSQIDWQTAAQQQLHYVKLTRKIDLVKLVLTRFTGKSMLSEPLNQPIHITSSLNIANQIDGEVVNACSGVISSCGSLRLFSVN